MKKLLLTLLCLFAMFTVEAQIDEDFSTWPPTGWSLNSDGSGSFIQGNSASLGLYAYYNCYNTQSAAPSYLQTPTISVTSTDKLFKFDEIYYLVSGTYGMASTLKVEVSADNGSTWTSSANLLTADGVMDTNIIDLTSFEGDDFTDSDVVVRFRATSDWGSWNIGVDNVFFPFYYPVAPVCSTNPLPADATSYDNESSITLSWDAAAEATSYDVYYGSDSSTPTLLTNTASTSVTEAFPINQQTYWKVVPKNATGSATGCSVQSFTVGAPSAPAGLSCDAGDQSTSTFSETFNLLGSWTGDISTTNTQGAWQTGNSGGTISGNTGPNAGQDGAYMYWEGSGTNGVSLTGSAISPSIDLSAIAVGEQAELTFYMHAFGAKIGTLSVSASSTVDGTYTDLFSWEGQTQASGAADWLQVGIDVSAYSGANLFVKFTVTGSGVDYRGDLGIDSMEVNICEAIPSCTIPSGLTQDSGTPTTVDISWTETGAANYNVAVYAAGADTSSAIAVYIEEGVGTTSTTVTGLIADTYYDAYVQADCGFSGISDFSSVAYLYTGYCIPSSANALIYINNLTTTSVGTNISNTGSGFSAGGYGDFRAQAITGLYGLQSFDVTFLNDGFYGGKMYAWVDWNNDLVFDNTAGSSEIVYTADDGNYGSGTFAVTIPDGQAAGDFVLRVKVQQASDGNPCGNMVYGEVEDYTVSVIETPSCVDVSDITYTSAGTDGTSSVVSWTGNGTTTNHNIKVYAAGADPATATAVYPLTAVSGTSTTVTGLTPYTFYDVYVQADCGSDDTSAFVMQEIFAGHCIPSTTYSSAGFDDVTTTGGTTNISNTGSGFSTGGYGNFRAQAITGLVETQSFSITLSRGTLAYGGKMYGWVDWNNDQAFDNTAGSSEIAFVLDNGNYGSAIVTVTIPDGQAAGNFTLRVKLQQLSDGEPCGDMVYGEVEDYTISVSEACSWNGDTSTDWATGSNWSTGVAPTSSDTVLVKGTFTNEPTISSTIAVAKTVIVTTDNTLTIDESSSLTVSGDFTNTGGTVTLNSTEAAFSSLIVTGTASGDITYNRYVNVYDASPGANSWDFVSSPVTMPIADFITANSDKIQVLGDDYAFASYDNEVGQWNLYATSSITCTTGGTETFTDIGSGLGYDDRSWTGDDGSTWTATNAIDGQTITGDAITLNRNAANTYVQSGTISGGICNITISTKRPFGSGSGTLDVLINGSSVGSVPFGDSVQTTTISDINITGDIVIRIDNNIGGTNGGGLERITIDDVTWTAATTQDLGSFTTGQGYAMATTTGAAVKFTGEMKTADQSIDIIKYNAVGGTRWNLVSNPYPSYIKGNLLSGANNFLGENVGVIDDEYLGVYGWNGVEYKIYNQLETPEGVNTSFTIAPGQAFWVAALSTTAMPLNFTADMRTTSGDGDFVEGPVPLTYKLELILKNETQKATTKFYFRDGLSLDLDPGYDAGSYNQSMALSTRLAGGNQETAFSINAMGMDAMQNTRVPLAIKQNAGQAFSLSIADMELPEDIYVYLEDTVNGTLTSLKDQDFELTAQNDLSGVDRFFIVFKSNSVLSSGDTLGINALNVFKANNDDFVTIAGITPDLGQLDVRLYSMLGQTVRQQTLNTTNATQRVSTGGLASGLYMVQIKSGNQTTVKKVIIK